jgi:NitT/TauT family transport system ATP-binding protein
MGNVDLSRPERRAGSGTASVQLPAVGVRDLTHSYPTSSGAYTALENVSFSAAHGEFVSIVGPSGCGKSTLLFVISSIVTPTTGEVTVLGLDAAAATKEIGFVFQRDALLPWRTALQNVALPLRFRGMSRAESECQSREWLARVGLAGFEDRFPHQLSGGMRKRVAIATSLVYRPKVLLMDEPFSALDAQTRNLMENDLLKLWQETRQTVVFITHDLEEAVALSDRVVTMTASPGRILSERTVDLGRPRNLLEVRFEKAFVRLHEELWHDLRAQVLQAASTPTDAQPVLARTRPATHQ